MRRDENTAKPHDLNEFREVGVPSESRPGSPQPGVDETSPAPPPNFEKILEFRRSAFRVLEPHLRAGFGLMLKYDPEFRRMVRNCGAE